MVGKVVVLAACLMASCPAIAQEQTPGTADATELAAVLAELDAAGTPATQQEIDDLVRQNTHPSGHGTLVSRVGINAEKEWSQASRAAATDPWWRVRLRWWRDRLGATGQAGAVSLGREAARLFLGDLSLPHGFGLLVGAPGRGSSLTADSRLGSRDAGLSPWSGQASPQCLFGAGLQRAWAGWEVRLLVGRSNVRQAVDRRAAVGQVIRRNSNSQWGICTVATEQGLGLSAAGRIEGDRFDSAWEVVWRMPAGAAVTLGATMVQAGWQLHRTVRVGVLSGWSRPGPEPAMGAKHGVLGDWAGQGTAVRGTWRPVRGLGVKVLVHRANPVPATTEGQQRLRLLTDIQIDGSWPSGWFGGARVRSNGEDVMGWTERFPWQPPRLVAAERRTVLSLRGGWRRDRSRIQLLWRGLSTDRAALDEVSWTPNQRRLLTLSVVHRLADGWLVRGTWSVAWGGNADLVTAAVPFGGYIVTRHWGHWRRERLLGLEYDRDSLQVALAASWREAAPDDFAAETSDQGAAWAQMGWSW